ncbi:hypothetical protein DFH08DRAFT_1073686 [Mycena albidolilacea]|uniref:Uncharacterized protein n=1 Tax=Mycena albidolilacea TaxID=1033008 RepID=A0AAD7AM10_9AGAR|nr:hypothetical protein DFH08DRAFT_1073686 [Mycena albidolilacea]
MHLISPIFVYSAIVLAVYANPVPVPQGGVPANLVQATAPSERDVFQPIDLKRAAQVDIQERDDPRDSFAYYCVIA